MVNCDVDTLADKKIKEVLLSATQKVPVGQRKKKLLRDRKRIWKKESKIKLNEASKYKAMT